MSDQNNKNQPFDKNDENPDPITGQPGAHPIGTGIGAAGAGTIGAVVGGVVGGPVGAVVGSAVGAVAGGLMGKGAAEAVNPTVEDEYWRTNYSSRSYVEKEHKYEDYQPAYQTGYEGYNRYATTGKTYDEVEPELQQEYEKNHGGAGLAWEKAKHATRDAWHKVENAIPGDDESRSDRNLNVGSNVNANDATVKLYQERLVANKHREKTGEVTVGKHVESETQRVSIPVEKERIVVERNSPTTTGRAVSPGDADFREGEVTRMEVYEETANVQKEAYVREQVDVRKEVDRETVELEEQVRREELDIDTQGRSVVDKNSNRRLDERL